MYSLLRKFITPFGALVLGVLFLITAVVISVSGVTHAANNNTPQSGRLLTIHDRGTDTVVLSQSATVGDALKDAGITLDDKDAVEPAVTAKLIASDYQINIYRARPVIIVDGDTRIKVITPYQTADQIAKSAGMTLYDGDVTTLERTSDIIADGAGLQLIIDRATPFAFTLYGKTSTFRTQGQTVADMLTEKGIELAKDDRVSPKLNTIITEGLAVRIWREGKQTITVSESIKFEVEQIKDADRAVGYLSVTTPGVKGRRSVSYEITIQDGKEVRRTQIASITTKKPIKQVEVVGAKGEYTTPSENESITWKYLTSNGFSNYQAAGIMGNIMQESNFNTSDSPGGYGLVQWTGGRRDSLMTMSYPDNIYTQLSFLMSELNSDYSGVRDAIKSTNTIDDAAIIFQDQFERCNPYYCMPGQRIQYGYDMYESLKN